MIVPLVEEPEWMTALGELIAFEPSLQPVLVVAPHPDDETLGAGGLIAALSQQGVEITVLAVTDGEHAYPESLTPNGPALDCKELGALRSREQTAALARLGVPPERIVRLHLPDSSVAAHQQSLRDCLERMVTRDTHIIAPWRGDFHPDHEACGRAAEEAARSKGAQLSGYFFWTWHRGRPSLLGPLPLRSFVLSQADMQAKAAALEAHQSQLVHPLQAARNPAEPDLAILPEYLLGPARRGFEVFVEVSSEVFRHA